MDPSFGLFPPFYTDCGKNIHIGKRVFINMGCKFQDQGGIFVDDGALIGHNVVLATLNHDRRPEARSSMIPAPIHIGKHVWIGANATVLPGVTIGDGAIVVREVPADIDAGDTTATLEEFAQNLRSGRSLEEKRENLLHTMACKAAIKGGWKSDMAELRVLVEKVRKGEVKYCPHGRPVAVKLTKYELEKMFKRA